MYFFNAARAACLSYQCISTHGNVNSARSTLDRTQTKHKISARVKERELRQVSVFLACKTSKTRPFREENLLPDIAVPISCFTPPQHTFTRAPQFVIQIESFARKIQNLKTYYLRGGKTICF